MTNKLILVWLAILTAVNGWLAWLFHDNGLF